MNLREELADLETRTRLLEARKAEIYAASLAAPESEKVCEDFVARADVRPLLAEVRRLRAERDAFARRAIAIACKDIADPNVRRLDVADVIRRAGS